MTFFKAVLTVPETSKTETFELDDVDVRAEITLISKNKYQKKYWIDWDKTVLFDGKRYISSDSSEFLEVF